MGEEKQRLPGIEIPDKMFFKIREVAQIVGVKPHVLRYWETEFSSLAPKKNRTGQRLYTRKDIENAIDIQKLLHVERFSIAGARQKLKKKKDTSSRKKKLQEARNELAEVLEALGADPAAISDGGEDSATSRPIQA